MFSHRLTRSLFRKTSSSISSCSYQRTVSQRMVMGTSLGSSLCLPLAEMKSFSSTTDKFPIESGDVVHIHIEGKHENGEVFDPRDDSQTVKFTVGSRQTLPGIEKGVIGMFQGDKKTLVVPPEDGFGPYREEYKIPIPKKELNMEEKELKNLKVGSVVMVDKDKTAVVNDITDDEIILDVNHAMAGKTLHFDIEIAQHIARMELPVNEQVVIPVQESQQGDNQTFPHPGDQLTMHYTGYLTDGTVFDSSVERGTPFNFIIGVGQVIKGWDEGVMRMSVGQKAKLYIPSNKGYGSQGAGDVIPPNSDLIFEVELLDIKRRS